MRPNPRRAKRVVALVTLPLWLLASATPAVYADGRGYQQSNGPSRSHHSHSPRPYHQPVPSGRPMGRTTPPAETRRAFEPETPRAYPHWNTPSGARHDRSVPERRPMYGAPPRHQVVLHRGGTFHYYRDRGFWYRSHGPRLIPVVAPFGAVVRVLPYYHTRIWFYGVPFPYYYASNVYYVQSSYGYTVAEPPAQQIIQEEPVTGPDSGSSITEEPVNGGKLGQTNADPLYVYPNQGQSQQQLDNDRLECRGWATGQTGYDPASSASPSGDASVNYQRALSACLEGRGYTVR